MWGPYRDGHDTTIGPFRLERADQREHVIVYRVVRR
jgi:hypothetical protein